MTTPYTETQSGLRKSGSAVLDASGNATIPFSTENARQRWEITSVVVATSQAATATPVPQAGIYVNGVYTGAAATTSAGGSEGVTWSGSQDVFTGQTDLGPCDQLAVVFTAGIPGTTAYANLRGTKYTRRA